MLEHTLTDLEREFHRTESRLADPEALADPRAYRELTRRHAELSAVMNTWRELQQTREDLQGSRELLADPEMAELAAQDVAAGEARERELQARLEDLLLPRDPDDHRGAILELRAGAGGAEAALFAADLLRMYTRHAEGLGLTLRILEASESDLGGLSKLVAELAGEGAYAAFKWERGVHRVQRVPATEAQGRIHTSTVTVAVLPEADEDAVELNPADVRIDVFRSQGAGGQSVNTTDSAVRAVYRPGTPEEIIVISQEGRSQIKNRERVLNVLRSKLAERARAEREASEREARQSQVGSGDRSEKIRTYNYPQNRVTDHRLDGDDKNHPLDTVIAGDLGRVVAALRGLERAQQAQTLGDRNVNDRNAGDRQPGGGA